MTKVVITALEAASGDKKVAVEKFGNIAFAKKEMKGKDLKKLVLLYKAQYQRWLEALNTITDEVCVEWDAYNDPTQKFLREASPEQLATLGLARLVQEPQA